ncbi:MAG TPA: efflux RND transporter permease subunit [Spirochaetota bacterium]|nr:efflux RND transporter permease subunit [Spirochaetota bacterium]
MKKLIQFFINQSKVVNLIVVFLTVAGGLVFWKGQKEGFPNVSLDKVWIVTSYFGSSPREAETLITDKIEDAVEDVDGLKQVTSRSTEGMSTVIVDIDADYSDSKTEVINDLRSAVDSVNDLPDDAQDPQLIDIKMEMIPVISVAVAGKADKAKLREAAKLIENDLKQIEGVGKLEIDGYQDQEIWIEVDPDKLKEMDIDISEVIGAVKLRNINLPGGKIYLKNKEYLIRTLGQYKTLAEVKNTIVRANMSGNTVRVKDIAKVSWQYEELEQIIMVGGRAVINLSVSKKKSGDIIKVADAVKARLSEYKKKDILPEGVRAFYADDLSYFVKRRLKVLTQNIFIGLILIFFCLIFFLDWRTTLWTVLGIPIAFCTAMLVANLMGLTLNLMSMFGFIIVIGMIVDDAIIVAENVFRHKEMGKGALQATIDGTVEVMKPVTATVATTIAAFMPLIALYGMMGRFLAIIPKVVSVAMVASFVECLFVLPGHLLHSRSRQNEKPGKDGNFAPKQNQPLATMQSRWFLRLQNLYSRILHKMLINSGKSFLAVGVIAFFIIIAAFKFLPFEFFPTSIDEINIEVETRPSNSLNQTKETIQTVENKLKNELKQDVREYLATVGFYDPGNGPRFRNHYGSIRLILNADRERGIKAIIKTVSGTMQSFQNSNLVSDYTVKQARGGPPQEKPISVEVYGNDIWQLKEVAAEIVDIVDSVSNTTAIASSFEPGKDELVIKVKDKKAAMAKVNVNATAVAVRNAFEGGKAAVANSMQGQEEDVTIMVKYNENKSRTFADLKKVKIKNAMMQNVPIGNYVEFATNKSTAIIHHKNAERVMYITGELQNPMHRQYTSDYISSLITPKLKALEKEYKNIRIEPFAGSSDQDKIMKSGIIAGMVALALILIILTALFHSFLQPFTVMSAIPFGALGALSGILLHYAASFIFPISNSMYSFGFMSIMGIIALAGVVVNDSLVLISFVNHNRALGMDKMEALLNAGRTRLRPVILTTLTTLVGLIPMAYGIMGDEPFLQPMAIALIWGLVFATSITLLILPCLYYMIDGLAFWFYNKCGWTYKLPTSLE